MAVWHLLLLCFVGHTTAESEGFGDAATCGSEGSGQCSSSVGKQRPEHSKEHLLLQLGMASSVPSEPLQQEVGPDDDYALPNSAEGGVDLENDDDVTDWAGEGGQTYKFADDAMTADSVGCNMQDVEQSCSRDNCKVLATNMRGRSCNSYCNDNGRRCVGAWEEVREDCRVKFEMTCDDASVPTSDLICQCSPSAWSPPVGSPGQSPVASTGASVPVSTFFWNVHWECSVAANGASHSCKDRIGHRFAELAQASNAEVVASIELSEGASRPSSLINFGLWGWTQVDGPCARGYRGDSAALAFAPTWHVESSGGGCLRHDDDTRAFAVARVVPPRPVKGCPKLCVVAIHAPHSYINNGKDTVRRVCGEAVERCAIAMGDWNIPANGVHGLWSSLIGGAAPSRPQPDVRTCCWPESHHYGVFDHLATNVQGAIHTGHTVHPYQLLEERPMKQHKAVSAQLRLPGA